MKAFFIKLIVLLALGGIAVFCEWARLEGQIQAQGPVLSNMDLVGRLVMLQRQVPNAKVVIAGDSKAQRNIDPTIFHHAGIPAINAGVPSTDLWAFVRTMEALDLQKWDALFLISVGSYQINEGHNDLRALSPEMYFEFTPAERLKMFRSGFFAEARAKLSQKETYDSFRSQILNLASERGYFAHFGFEAMPPNDFTCIKFRHNSGVAPYSTYRNIKTDGGRWRLFEAAIRKLETWGGNYILYNSPESPKGRECIRGSYGEDLEREFARKVGEVTKGMSRVRFVDLYFSEDLPLENKHYYDPGHLNRDGAAAFSRWWIAALGKP